MKYTTGKPGRIVVARFDDGDDLLEGLKEISLKENIRAAAVYLVGGLKGGKFVTGPEDATMPPKPVWGELTESHETLAFGTIFYEGNEPRVHMHGTFGKKGNVKMGCLRTGSETFLILEAIIVEIDGIDAKRVLDPKVGLPLLEL